MITCRGKEEENKVAQLAELLNLDKSEILRRAIEQGFHGTIDDRGPWAVLHGGGDRTRPPAAGLVAFRQAAQFCIPCLGVG
jgi:hypothetical protein